MKAKERPRVWVEQFQQKLYLASKASETRRFGLLYDKIYRMDVLQEAWKRVKRNRGSAGIDGKSIKKIERDIGVETFLAELHEELKSGQYTASNIRRVYIPKGVNDKRPLGIPTVKDRVVQMAVKLIIEPLFESDFLDCSYGFRPRRSNTQAVKLAHYYSNSSKWIVDVDLKSYFDNVSHEHMLNFLKIRIKDKSILHLIEKFLKAGYMDSGLLVETDTGTPQGSILTAPANQPIIKPKIIHRI